MAPVQYSIYHMFFVRQFKLGTLLVMKKVLNKVIPSPTPSGRTRRSTSW